MNEVILYTSDVNFDWILKQMDSNIQSKHSDEQLDYVKHLLQTTKVYIDKVKQEEIITNFEKTYNSVNTANIINKQRELLQREFNNIGIPPSDILSIIRYVLSAPSNERVHYLQDILKTTIQINIDKKIQQSLIEEFEKYIGMLYISDITIPWILTQLDSNILSKPIDEQLDYIKQVLQTTKVYIDKEKQNEIIENVKELQSNTAQRNLLQKEFENLGMNPNNISSIIEHILSVPINKRVNNLKDILETVIQINIDKAHQEAILKGYMQQHIKETTAATNDITEKSSSKSPRTRYQEENPYSIEKNTEQLFQVPFTYNQATSFPNLQTKCSNKKPQLDCVFQSLAALRVRSMSKCVEDSTFCNATATEGVFVSEIEKYLSKITGNTIEDILYPNTEIPQLSEVLNLKLKNNYGTIAVINIEINGKQNGHAIIIFKNNNKIYYFDPQAKSEEDTIIETDIYSLLPQYAHFINLHMFIQTTFTDLLPLDEVESANIKLNIRGGNYSKNKKLKKSKSKKLKKSKSEKLKKGKSKKSSKSKSKSKSKKQKK